MADEQVYVGEEGAKELYRRIKSLIPAVDDSLDITSGNAISNRAVTEALGMVTSFVKAEGTGPDKHPDVENPSGRVIYLVHDELAPNPDQYKEWIWSTPPGEEPLWECIGDTTTTSADMMLEYVEGTVTGDRMDVFIDNGKYSFFIVPKTIKTLAITVSAPAEVGNVSKLMFQFYLEDGAVLDDVSIIDEDGVDTLPAAPMRYPGNVIYQGSVINGVSTMIGHSPTEVDPLNPLGLPDYTIRLKFSQGVTPEFAKGTAEQVDTAENVWDLTYQDSDWESLLHGQSGLVAVLGANTSNVVGMKGMFNGCSNLESIALFNTSRVETMCGTFGYCPKLEAIPQFDMSNVSNMCYAFSGCTSLKSFTGFNLPNLRSASIMFSGCHSLEEVSFDSSKVVIFDYMFQGCTSLVHGPNLNTSSATSMDRMFDGCTALEDVPAYDVSKVTNFYEMFYGCSALTTVPALNTASAKSMEFMFANCSSLENAPVMNTATVENMKYMFSGCSALSVVPEYSTESLKECEFMFCNAGITYIPNIDFSNIKVLNGLFASCPRLTVPPTRSASTITLNFRKANSINYMFSSCTSLNVVPNMIVGSLKQLDSAFEGCVNIERGAFDLYVSLLDNSNINSHSNTFKDCGVDTESGLSELSMIHTTWGGLMEIPLDTLRCKYAEGTSPSMPSYVITTLVSADENIWDITASSWMRRFQNDTNLIEVIGGNIPLASTLYATFDYATNLTNVGKICTSSNLDNLEFTFNMCSNLTSVERFETCSVTTMRCTFQGCSALISVPYFNTSNVTSMHASFYGCQNLPSVPLFDTSNVTDMQVFLENCSSLVEIPRFNTSKVTNMRQAFYGCTSITTIPLLDTSSVTTMEETFKKCYNVESGALAIYQQASTQSNPPSNHSYTFSDCGVNTVAGLSELGQIPGDWGGLLSPNITMQFTEGTIPSFSTGTAKQLSTTPNVWKLWTGNATSWNNLLSGKTELLKVLDADMKGEITRARYMCSGCTNLSSVSISNTANLTDTYYMFDSCSSLSSVLFTGDIKPINAAGMFNNCSSLSNFVPLDTTRCTNLNQIYQNCSSLTNAQLNAIACTQLRSAFRGCTSLATVEIQNTENLIDIYQLFDSCTSLSTIPQLDLNSVTDTSYAFNECRNVVSGAYNLFMSLYSKDIRVNSYSNCFTNCGIDTETGRTELGDIASFWGGLAIAYLTMKFSEGITPSFAKGNLEQLSAEPNIWKLTTTGTYDWRRLCAAQTELLEVIDMRARCIADMYDLFNGCTKLTTIHVMDTDGLTKQVAYIFGRCSSLVSVPPMKIAGSGAGVFYNCASIENIPALNTSEMYGIMYGMFMNTKITSTPKLDMRNVTTAEAVFDDCKSLTTINANDFTLGNNLTQVNYMFANCNNVEHGAYDMYSKLSSINSITSHEKTFSSCGYKTESGIADLMKIPADWGGWAPVTKGTVTIGGKSYNTISIGTKEWLAESLDYKFTGCEISSASSHVNYDINSPAAWYYDDDENQYSLDGEKKCGLLYNGLAGLYIETNKNTLLPAGWRIPKFDDWTSSFGWNIALKAPDHSVTENWPDSFNGIGAYQMNLLPSGYYCDNVFQTIGTASQYAFYGGSGESAYIGRIEFSSDMTPQGWSGHGIPSTGFAISIRLVRDIQ